MRPVVQTTPGADNVRRLALLNIGRIGRQASLKDFPQMQQTLISALAGNSEDIKAAASLALGGVAIGDLNTHLPFIIRQIQEQVCKFFGACGLFENATLLAWRTAAVSGSN